MKKVLFAVSCLIVGLSLTACGGGDSYKDAEIAQLKQEIAELKAQNEGKVTEVGAVEAPEMEEVSNEQQRLPSEPSKGIYRFTDAQGDQWTLQINSDGTATLGNSSETHYGKVDEKKNGYIKFYFNVDIPEIPTSKGEENFMYPALDLKEGYLYSIWNAYESKNPKLRIKMN